MTMGIAFDGVGASGYLTVVASGRTRALYGGDVRLLEWYFTQYAFERSTFGATLARQEARYRDSTGKVIQRGDDWSWVSGRVSRPTALLDLLGIDHPQPPMHVNEDPAEGRSEPDDEALTKHAQVSRRLLGVERQGRIHTAVLGAYYGNDGIGWQGFTNGRLWAMSPLTETGAAMLARGRVGPTLTPAKALAESVKGNNEGKIQREAAVLLEAAETAWRATAPPRRDRREESRERIRELRLVLA